MTVSGIQYKIMWLKHGQSRKGRPTPEYVTWQQMLARCTNTKHKQWSSYGGRGISVYAPWYQFEEFFKYVGARPSKDLSLDRINNDGNYEPGNVRWATRSVQARNRRSSRILEHNGVRKTTTEWAIEVGLPHGTIQTRLTLGWPVERILFEPVSRGVRSKTFEYLGEKKTLKQWAEKLGVKEQTIRERIRRGWTLEKALLEPVEPWRQNG